MSKKYRHLEVKALSKIHVVCAVVLIICGTYAIAQEPGVKAAISTKSMFLGETLTFQLQISGDDSPPEPDVSHIKDFTVESLGGRQNSSSQVTVINGNMQRYEFKGYMFNYALTPKRAGTLTIPAIRLTAGNKRLKTQPIAIQVSTPSERSDMKLLQLLPATPIYPGQPFTLTVRWLISTSIVRSVEDWSANIPALNTVDFKTIESELKQKPDQREMVADGKRYLGVTWKYTLFANRSGEIAIPAASLSCKLVEGRQRSNNPFGDSFFFGNRRRVYDKAVIPSNALKLTVKALPATGKPTAFNGLIGNYTIEAQASPKTVNVGDPITLRLMISGPNYLGNVPAPALEKQQQLIRDFKLASDIPKGKMVANRLVFETVIRANHPDVKEIPAIELPFFDARKNRYTITRSKPIPITVKATKVVTALDAEGTARGPAQAAKGTLESNTQGIAHNYGIDACLQAHVPSGGTLLASTGGITLVSVPPVVWLVLCVMTGIIRKRQSNPLAVKSRRALGILQADLQKVSDDSALLEAVKHYLGSKLYLQAGALTFKDVETGLSKRHVDDAIINQLASYFDRGEAARFAGGSSGGDMTADIADVNDLAKKLEKAL